MNAVVAYTIMAASLWLVDVERSDDTSSTNSG